MRSRFALASFGMYFLLSVTGPAADWPRFLGPNADGISAETGINKDWNLRPPKELWKVSLSDHGYAGPSVADGKVFIVDHQGSRDIVRALDLGTGNDIWRFDYEDAKEANYGFARATPTVDSGRVYTLSMRGNLFCLEAATGTKLWHVDLRARFDGKPPPWDYSGSPLVDGDRLIVTPGGPNAAVAALDKTTGETIWHGGGSDAPGYATPVVAELGGRKQYVVFTAKNLVGVDAEAGELLWKLRWHTDWDVNAATPIVVGTNVFITSDYMRGCALLGVGPAGVSTVWENKAIRSHFSTGVYSGGHVYSTTIPGRLVCVDLRKGTVKWRHRRFERGGLCAIDGTLIVCDGRRGDVVMVKMSPRGYRELGRINPLGGQSWTAPVVADKKLIVRNKRAMVCLDLR